MTSWVESWCAQAAHLVKSCFCKCWGSQQLLFLWMSINVNISTTCTACLMWGFLSCPDWPVFRWCVKTGVPAVCLCYGLLGKPKSQPERHDVEYREQLRLLPWWTLWECCRCRHRVAWRSSCQGSDRGRRTAPGPATPTHGRSDQQVQPAAKSPTLPTICQHLAWFPVQKWNVKCSSSAIIFQNVSNKSSLWKTRAQYAQEGGISDLQSVFFEYLQVINASHKFK